MKSRHFILAITVSVVMVLSIATTLVAQEVTTPVKKARHHHYKLIDTGTLGGPTSSLGFEGERDINNRGQIVSLADTSLPDPYAPNCFLDCFLAHTVEWRHGVLTDLGALPPLNNSGPIWISDTGLIAGMSQNGIDPLTGQPAFRAALWEHGNITDLGTFGGNESAATSVNERGDVVGCAAGAEPDSFGFCPGVQRSRAFLWENGVMKDLGTLGGPDAFAELVNNRGQVAGWSLTNSTVNPATGIPTQHLFLWENGKMRDLGTIGGTKVQLINDLNERGQFVGSMNVAGDESFHPFLWNGSSLRDLGTLGGDFGGADWINEMGQVVGWAFTSADQASHAFLWRDGGMTDLGTVDGDPNSIAYGINSAGEVVGSSQDGSFSFVHAFLWERGSIADLNGLIPADSGVQLNAAPGINERGEIVAQGVVLLSGNTHAFLLIPCDDDHPDIEGCDYSMIEAVEVSNNAAAPQSSQAIPPTMDSLSRTINPSQNWFRQCYRMLGQQPALRH